MRVVVYKNLNLGNWTVAEVSGRSGRGRKIAGVASVVLADVTFHVQPAAQRKVAEGAARSVHAWCIGDVSEPISNPRRKTEVTYNPRRGAEFTTRDGRAVHAAECIEFSSDGRAYSVV